MTTQPIRQPAPKTTAGPPRPADTGTDRLAVVEAARALEQWCRARGWSGTDPYDALNATRLSSLPRRTATGRRVLTQVVKRSPIDVRRALGIPLGRNAAALAWAASAYARDDGTISGDPAQHLHDALEGLCQLRCAAYSEPCWGYHFDVQTRVFFYPRVTPNTIATTFAGHALLDAHARTAETRWLELARGAGTFLIDNFPATRAPEGIFFGYLIGDRTPIHNANLLVCSLLARLAQQTGSDQLAELATEGVAYAVAHQRPDGSWPYGERPQLAWIDNFHTGYVLEALMRCRAAGIGGAGLDTALERGLSFYRRELFCPNGAPKYYPSSLYPIDAQCVAQGIQTFALASSLEPGYAEWAWRVAGFALARMRRRDGAFMFQRRRWWSNRTPHMRWCQAPMLLAFAHLLDVPAQ